MTFPEADRFNAVNGNQFIADLMPRHPVYTSLLPEAAQEVIGKPHTTGRAALAMLEAEGFSYDNYVDIFDGGPTVTARTDQLRTIRDSRLARIAQLADSGDNFTPALLAAGRLTGFRAWLGHVAVDGDTVTLPVREAETMGLAPGDEVRHVSV
jgi:arginine N-succinyltransferase